MNQPINIHKSDHLIELLIGNHNVKVLGGWVVEVGNFSLQLKNINNGKIIEPKRTRRRIQSFAFNYRAKKMFTIDIQ